MRRIAELDGLRGAAAVMVVAFHIFMNRLPWGWAAVDVFFVLSGYLITTIVLKQGQGPSWHFLAAFYTRRGLRTWPIYYLLILVLVLWGSNAPRALPYYLTYLQQAPRYWGGEVSGWVAMEHTWTLALEEQFYLIWPALVLIAGRRRTGPMALALAVASIAARGAGAHWFLLAGRCDGFALGAFLAAVLGNPDPARGRRLALRWAAGLGAIALLLAIGLAAQGRLLAVGDPTYFRAQATIASLASFALVALVTCSINHPLLAPLRMAPLVYLGTISYGLYIYHYPIVMSSQAICRYLGVRPGPVLWGTEALLTLAAAVASWHLIEKPILRLKDRVPYRSVRAWSRAKPVAVPNPIREPAEVMMAA